jgi:hypothetical protein
MNLASLCSGFLPAPFFNVFKRQSPSTVIAGTWEKFDFEDGHFAFGIERVTLQTNPLKGKIIHRSTHPREYYAAMGREEDSSIDFTQPAVIQKLKSLIERHLSENPDHQMALSTICQLRRSPKNLTIDIMIRDVAENAGSIVDIDEVILEELGHIDLPSECRSAVRWLKSNLSSWRLKAYLESEKPLFWPLDFHRHGTQVYSRSGTTPGSIGTVYDEAVWIPSDDLYDEIVALSEKSNPRSNPYEISIRVLDTNLKSYNAYLKQQVFEVVKYECDCTQNYVELSRSKPCFGFDESKAEKEKLVQLLWSR